MVRMVFLGREFLNEGRSKSHEDKQRGKPFGGKMIEGKMSKVLVGKN